MWARVTGPGISRVSTVTALAIEGPMHDNEAIQTTPTAPTSVVLRITGKSVDVDGDDVDDR